MIKGIPVRMRVYLYSDGRPVSFRGHMKADTTDEVLEKMMKIETYFNEAKVERPDKLHTVAIEVVDDNALYRVGVLNEHDINLDEIAPLNPNDTASAFDLIDKLRIGQS